MFFAAAPFAPPDGTNVMQEDGLATKVILHRRPSEGERGGGETRKRASRERPAGLQISSGHGGNRLPLPRMRGSFSVELRQTVADMRVDHLCKSPKRLYPRPVKASAPRGTGQPDPSNSFRRAHAPASAQQGSSRGGGNKLGTPQGVGLLGGLGPTIYQAAAASPLLALASSVGVGRTRSAAGPGRPPWFSHALSLEVDGGSALHPASEEATAHPGYVEGTVSHPAQLGKREGDEEDGTDRGEGPMCQACGSAQVAAMLPDCLEGLDGGLRDTWSSSSAGHAATSAVNAGATAASAPCPPRPPSSTPSSALLSRVHAWAHAHRGDAPGTRGAGAQVQSSRVASGRAPSDRMPPSNASASVGRAGDVLAVAHALKRGMGPLRRAEGHVGWARTQGGARRDRGGEDGSAVGSDKGRQGERLQGEEEEELKAVKPIRYTAYDMDGNMFCGDELRNRRNAAVLKGMTYMKKFLSKGKCKALYDIGDDAPSIFFEIWYTCGHSSIRAHAKAIAVTLTKKLQRWMLANPKPLHDLRQQRDEFFAFIFILRSELEMGMECADELMEAAKASWERNNFADTSRLFGVSRAELDSVGTGPWLELLMRILIMDYINILLTSNAFPTSYNLKDAFEVLRQHRYSCTNKASGATHAHFHDSFYLATHIVYALSAYSGIKTRERDVPWLYRYCRRSFVYWMKNAKRKLKDISTYVDIDGVGELIDILRGTGLTEVTDKMTCHGTVWILDNQLQDGSWPVWFDGEEAKEKHSFYDRLHSTWVCTQALRERDFKVNEDCVRLWQQYIQEIVKTSNFGKLGYRPDW